MITILTWGKSKRSVYPDTDLKVDCHCLTNPPSVLWSLDGRSSEVRQYIVDELVRDSKLNKWFNAVERAILKYAEKHPDFSLGFFCQGGRHRSVSMAELLSQILRNKKFEIEITHMELA